MKTLLTLLTLLLTNVAIIAQDIGDHVADIDLNAIEVNENHIRYELHAPLKYLDAFFLNNHLVVGIISHDYTDQQQMDASYDLSIMLGTRPNLTQIGQRWDTEHNSYILNSKVVVYGRTKWVNIILEQ